MRWKMTKFRSSKLYGIQASKIKDGNPYFDKTALERFCYNNEYPYPFADDEAEDGLNGLDNPYQGGETEHCKPIDESSIEIIEGVTVGDLRAMIRNNQALGDVLAAVNQWRNLSEDRKPPNSLYAALNIKAKGNKWGLDNNDYSITQKQYEEIGDIFIQSSKKLIGGKEKRKYPKWEEFKNKIKS